MAETVLHRRARFEPPLMRVPVHQIGGGKVVRRFRMGDSYVEVGKVFTGDELRALPAANRQILLDRFINVWPLAPSGLNASPVSSKAKRAEGHDRHVVSLGFRNYAVIEGVKLNDRPLTREEAFALAGKPLPVDEAPARKRREKEH